MQDPSSLDKFNLANFHHLKNNLKVVNEGKPAFIPGLVMQWLLSDCELLLIVRPEHDQQKDMAFFPTLFFWDQLR